MPSSRDVPFATVMKSWTRMFRLGEVKSGAGPAGSQLEGQPSGLEACSVRPVVLFAGPAAIRITRVWRRFRSILGRLRRLVKSICPHGPKTSLKQSHQKDDCCSSLTHTPSGQGSPFMMGTHPCGVCFPFPLSLSMISLSFFFPQMQVRHA